MCVFFLRRLRGSHNFCDVMHTFSSENRVQDCAELPVAVAVSRRKVIFPVLLRGSREKRNVGREILLLYFIMARTSLLDDVGTPHLRQNLPSLAFIAGLVMYNTQTNSWTLTSCWSFDNLTPTPELRKNDISHLPSSSPSLLSSRKRSSFLSGYRF